MRPRGVHIAEPTNAPDGAGAKEIAAGGSVARAANGEKNEHARRIGRMMFRTRPFCPWHVRLSMDDLCERQLGKNREERAVISTS